jgi:hypothetical protein
VGVSVEGMGKKEGINIRRKNKGEKKEREWGM